MNSQFVIRNSQFARILIRGVNWLGDAVMTTPALMRLCETFPDSHIALLTPEKLKDLWTSHPAVNETISFAPGESIFAVGRKLRRWGEATDEPALARQIPRLRETPAREEAPVPTLFDLALVLPNSPRSAMEMWLARNSPTDRLCPSLAEFLPDPGHHATRRSHEDAKIVRRRDQEPDFPDPRPKHPRPHLQRIKSTSTCTSSRRWARIRNQLRRNCSFRRRKSKPRKKNSAWIKSRSPFSV